ncbi:MAG: (Fe-S)-binding protein [Proteobacteria bacterium]|nr:(Fe-S)-binding protein [Pseudomonadota bacterium]
MGPLGITALLLAAFAAFAWFSARKLALVAALQPEVRWDHPWRRLRTVVTNGLLQQRMIRREWKPGVMHTVIFLGFVSLLVRKLQLVVIGFDAEFALTGSLGDAFTVWKDFVEVGVLLAVSYAFYRRLLLKPARLEPNREGLLVLGLITVIMVTDLAFDAFRFAQLADSVPAIAHERDHAPIGGWLASLVAGWSSSALATAAAVSYWTQMITVCVFLVLLPLGEHFHIVTALPALFFRRGRPANAVPTVDLSPLMDDSADASELKVGARSVADLLWKDALDAFTCTECGRCKDACPAFQTGKPLSMKGVNDSLKRHLLEQREAILAGGEAKANLPALVGDVISEDTLWSCTTCGYCEAACPIELELLPKFYRLRQHRVMMDGEFPAELKNVFDAYEVQSNPWGLPADTRGRLGQGPRRAAHPQRYGHGYYVGSAESFDQNGQRIARAFVEILREAGVRFGILGAQEPSTGECVRRAGNEMLFQQLATTLVESFNGLGVKRIVTCDPHAFNSLRNEYPAFGGRWEIEHHTQLIDRLLAEKRIEVRPTHERVLLHDPCYLGRHNGEFEAPRAVLGRVAKDELLEFPLHREKSMCCGAGGARMWMEEHIGTRINVTRVEQGLQQRPNVIATACPYCSVMLGDGLKAKNLNETIVTRDVAELVASAMVRNRASG